MVLDLVFVVPALVLLADLALVLLVLVHVIFLLLSLVLLVVLVLVVLVLVLVVLVVVLAIITSVKYPVHGSVPQLFTCSTALTARTPLHCKTGLYD